MGLVAAMLVLRKNTSEPGARSTGLRFRSYLTPWHIDGKAIGG
jgi:hypothetical protein